MIDFNAIFKLSYGLYIISTGDQSGGNGYIANAAFQVTAEPPKIAVCCNKDNFSADLIQKHGVFSLSILSETASNETIGKYGYKCGRDVRKFEGSNIKYGETGVPIVLDDSVAFIECKLLDTFDVGTHLMFIGEIISAELIEDADPLTYAYYRKVHKGLAPKNAPTYVDKSQITPPPAAAKSDGKKYKCNVCGYVYDNSENDVEFDSLPDDWECPICSMDKEEFSEI